jgi:uncharacterized lipoprotein YddW (UPF0748 family)
MKKLITSIAVFFCIQFAKAQQAEPIRGTWVTNVASEVLLSKKNIEEAVKLCKEAGMNTIFMVVWNNGVTMYPSKVLQKYIGVKQSKVYGNRDPLKEMIEVAHAQGLKVHAWFEFGFSYAHNDSNSVWLKKYPHWAGKMSNGNLLQKNKFYWWNGLHLEPQQFLKELVVEVAKNYEVDGVQGDDRLPAMASEGGYDAFTKKLYAKDFKGKPVPANPKDAKFIDWKASKLSAFAKQLYNAVKKAKPTCLVTWAPSIYPWAKENYLQDWPTWLKGGYADYIFPQCYRYKIEDYKKVIDEMLQYVPKNLKDKVFPGILTSLGNGYQASKELMNQMVAYNRSKGLQGEVCFYFETLKRVGGYYDFE